MARRCELTGTSVQSGNNVSHSHHKTRRRFLPNLQNVSLASVALNQTLRLSITVATLRSVDHNGGLDGFLVNSSQRNLSDFAKKLRRKVLNATASTEEKSAEPKKKQKEEAA